jgi:maltose 6'-phosphate phosphatase
MRRNEGQEGSKSVRESKKGDEEVKDDPEDLKTPVVIASYNLHGIQDNDAVRFPQIAEELIEKDVDICGFQEVIKSSDIEDTSFQIARHMGNLTGNEHYTYWAFCHPFFDRYPEGLSILSRFPIKNPRVIDLTVKLKNGAKPLLPRIALAAELSTPRGRIIAVSLHLDHHPQASLRTAQAALLVKSLASLYRRDTWDDMIITGDFNSREQSMCLRFLKRKGFTDTYRFKNKTGGATFPSCGARERIDFILHQGNLKVRDSFLFLKDPHLSDHLGVGTVLC